MKQLSPRRKVLALFAVASCTAMIFLDSTVLPVALPTIQRQLHVSPNGLQWILNAYLLSISSLVLAGGRIADLFGHRRVFAAGLLIFAGASALGGLAMDSAWLIAARAIQGCGGALMGPAGMSILIEVFPLKERGRALGFLVGFSSLFLSLGPFLGGLFTQYLTWRLVFWVNLPVAIIGALLALSVVPRSKKVTDTFDTYGFIFMTLTLFSLILALMQGEAWGWRSPYVIGLFVLSLLFGLALYKNEGRSAHPFIDFTLFRDRCFFGGNLVILCIQFMLMMTVYWAIYFQTVLFYTPMQAGLMTLIATLPLMVFAPLSGQLLDRVGPRIPLAIGFSLIIFGFAWFYFFLRQGSGWFLAPALFAFGSGISFVMTPNTTTTLSRVPGTRRGSASGVYNSMRYFGATLGIAVLGTLITGLTHVRFRYELKKVSDIPAEDYYSMSKEALAALPIHMQNLLKENFVESSFFAYTVVTLVAAGVALLGLILSMVYFKNYRRR